VKDLTYKQWDAIGKLFRDLQTGDVSVNEALERLSSILNIEVLP